MLVDSLDLAVPMRPYLLRRCELWTGRPETILRVEMGSWRVVLCICARDRRKKRMLAECRIWGVPELIRQNLINI